MGCNRGWWGWGERARHGMNVRVWKGEAKEKKGREIEREEQRDKETQIGSM